MPGDRLRRDGRAPLEALTLIGLGFRRLSMSAAAIGPVKAMLLALETGPARAAAPQDLLQPGHAGVRRAAARLAARRAGGSSPAGTGCRSDADPAPEKLDAILARHAIVSAMLNGAPDPETFVALSRELAELDPVVEAIRVYRAARDELAGIDAMLAEDAIDAEMRALGRRGAADELGRDRGGRGAR